MKKKFLFISCEEAKHICDKAQYGEATNWERAKLNMRLMWCHITKNYSKNNRKLTKAIQETDVNCLKKYELEKLQKEFNQELSKHQY